MSLLCNACNWTLTDEAALKVHYRSDYHFFNLKRRVAELPPVPLALYEAKVAEAAAAAEEAAAKDVECIYLCDACSKRFASEEQLGAHLRSKKHVARVKEILAERKAAAAAAAAAASEAASAPATAGGAGEASEAAPSHGGGVSIAGYAEEERKDGDEEGAAPGGRKLGGGGGGAAGSNDEDEEDDDGSVEEVVVGVGHCLFCFEDCGDLVSSLAHMRSAHSFFLPDLDALTDVEGLLEYLLHKVVEECKCIYCKSDKVYASPEAAQQHMIAKSHCKLRYEDEADIDEYSPFYTYPETSEDESEPLDIPEGARIIHTPSGDAYVNEAGDLVLPSGRVAAHHRSYARYYAQHYRTPDPRVTAQLERLALEWERSGGTSARAAAAVMALDGNKGGSRGKGLRAIGVGARGNNVDTRGQYAAARYQAHFALATGLGMNQIRRKYFRLQMRE